MRIRKATKDNKATDTKKSDKAKNIAVTKADKDVFQSLTIQGTKYTTKYTKKFINRKIWEKPDEKKIYSYIPGTVIKLHVKDGQKVQKGDHLLVLEAMKMANEIIAPFNGIIKQVNVKEGLRIPKGFLMLEFKTIG